MTKKQIRIKKPTVELMFNKHHLWQIFALEKGEFIEVQGVNPDAVIKRVGPAIVEVRQIGMKRTITSHPINGKELWESLSSYLSAGVWALNSKAVAAHLPSDLIEKSRFKGIDLKNRRRIENAERTRTN